MKSCWIVLPVSLLLLCCTQTKDKEQAVANEPHDSRNPKFTLDSLGRLDLDRLKELGNSIDELFTGTRQAVELKYSRITVKSESDSLPESNAPGLPAKWKTREGVYAGIPLDSLQAINGVPFYIAYANNILFVANWEGGKLAGRGIWIKLTAIKGDIRPFISSADIIKNGWDWRCSELQFFPGGWREPKEPCRGFPGDHPFLSYREVSDADFEQLMPSELVYVRNEIFARHGYSFKNKILKQYFTEFGWYDPKSANVDAQLSDVERTNIKLIYERETKNTNSPLAKLIRGLPFLRLPFDLEDSDAPVPLPAGMEGPDARTSDENNRSFYGLLPDTSLFYGVVWKGPAPKKEDGTAKYLSTFDKNMNPIQTAPIALFSRSRIEETGCTITDELVSTLNPDWTYSSNYSAEIRCPTSSGNETKSTVQGEVSGIIAKDGTIEETATNPSSNF